MADLTIGLTLYAPEIDLAASYAAEWEQVRAAGHNLADLRTIVTVDVGPGWERILFDLAPYPADALAGRPEREERTLASGAELGAERVYRFLAGDGAAEVVAATMAGERPGLIEAVTREIASMAYRTPTGFRCEAWEAPHG